MKLRIFLSFLLLFICYSNLPAFSMESGDEGLEFLLFEEIPMVEIASKRIEPLADASSTVRQYSQKDIEHLGYYTVADLADITPGYTSYYIYGEKVFETRGQKAGSWNNNKHTLFVDGIPVHHARNYKVNTEWELPLFFADSVEFLSGPASALYGTGAFYGAVAIHSKDLKENGNLIESKVFGSSLDSEYGIMNNMIVNRDTAINKIFLGYYDKQASKEFTGPFDDDGNLLWDDQQSIFFYGSSQFKKGMLQGVSVGLILNKKTGGMGEFWNGIHGGSNEINEVVWQQLIPFLKYEKRITDDHLFKSYLKYNTSKEKADFYEPSRINNISSYESNVGNYELLLELQSNLTADIQSVFGFNFDTRDDDLVVNSVDQIDAVGNVSTYSAYGQLTKEFPVLFGLIATGGVRYDKVKAEIPDVSFNKTTPRVSLVQKIDERWRVKASYGKAFRSPGIKEFGLNSESTIASGRDISTLGPELIETVEGTISYSTSRMSGNLVVFRSKGTDTIDASSFKDDLEITRNYFFNRSGELISNGVEFDCRYAFSEDIAFIFNASYAKTTDENDVEFADVPTQTANFIWLNHFHTGVGMLETALVYRFIDKFRVSDGSIARVDGGNVVDINSVLRLSKNTSVELAVKNVFDEMYKLPKTNIADIPIPKRSIIVRIKKTF